MKHILHSNNVVQYKREEHLKEIKQANDTIKAEPRKPWLQSVTVDIELLNNRDKGPTMHQWRFSTPAAPHLEKTSGMWTWTKLVTLLWPWWCPGLSGQLCCLSIIRLRHNYFLPAGSMLGQSGSQTVSLTLHIVFFLRVGRGFVFMWLLKTAPRRIVTEWITTVTTRV